MMNLQFEHAEFGFLFILPFSLIIYYYFNKVYNKPTYIKYSNINSYDNRFNSIFNNIKNHGLFALQIISLSFFIIASMSPFKSNEIVSVKKYGIDIVIALDASASMRLEDYAPKNRFEAAKIVLKDFVKKRKNDRIGLILFGEDAFIQAPQTGDYQALIDIIDSLYLGMIPYNKTAVGAALSVSASRVLKSKASSQIIILISDGEDTAYEKIRPLSAASAIKELGYKVYTIGIGSDNPRARNQDFSTLAQIAKETGGKFYKVQSTKQFQFQMSEIDRLEKSFIQNKKFTQTQEFTKYFFTIGMIFLGLYLLFDKILFYRAT